MEFRRYQIRILFAAVFLFTVFLLFINEPPAGFPAGGLIKITSGQNITSIAANLKAEHVIRSATLFKVLVIFSGYEQKIAAGEYALNRPISTLGLVTRFISGNFSVAPLRFTIPEGSSMQQIADLLSPKLKDFSVADFMKYSPEKEGYLFPDTYVFLPDTKADEIIDTLNKNFEEKIKTITSAITLFGRPEKDVVTMASILQKEANNSSDWQTIAGILWKRLEIGMPLQVDSTISYAADKPGVDLTFDDLKTDSPYNTYTHKGLPPTPISNPGLGAIEAAVTPSSTPYLYYLSDRYGVIHYAATFAEHVKNRQKYLP